MKTIDIVIACADDWQGLYVDGKLKYENHTVDLEERLGGTIELPVVINSVDHKWCEESWTDPEEGDFDGFPEDLKDVVFA